MSPIQEAISFGTLAPSLSSSVRVVNKPATSPTTQRSEN
jgi:hypothetical protein